MEKINKNTNQIYLSIGSNLGDRIKNIEKSIQLIQQEIGRVNQISSIYENPPLGFNSDQQFLNLCLEVESKLKPIELLKKTQQIERLIGRKTKTNIEYSSRIIDIDIIYYRNEIIKENELVIPHPKRTERNFVLTPLIEITENFIDPELNIDLISLKRNCLDLSILVKTINTLQLN
jgi:deoxyguanosine kinase